MNEVMQNRYPKADVKGFLKGVVWIWGCVIFLHWLPDLATWFYLFFYGEPFAIRERPFKVFLVIAYIMASLSTLFELSGMLYATYQNRNLDREVQQRQRSAAENQAGSS